jgi:hypothetical protein
VLFDSEEKPPPMRAGAGRCLRCGLQLVEVPNDLGGVMLVEPQEKGPYAIHAGILRVLSRDGSRLLQRGSVLHTAIRRLKKAEIRYGSHVARCPGSE